MGRVVLLMVAVVATFLVIIVNHRLAESRETLLTLASRNISTLLSVPAQGQTSQLPTQTSNQATKQITATDQIAAPQLLSLYQPIQNIVWEGQYTSAKGIAYFADRGEAQLTDFGTGDPLREAIALHANGEYDRAIPGYLASLEETRNATSRDQAQEIMLLGNLGLAYAATGLYYEAIDYFNQYFAQTWHKAYYYQGTDPKLGGLALGNIGKVYLAGDVYLKAIEIQERRLALSQELKDQLGEAQALGDLGMVYQAIGEYPKALEFQEKSLALARTLQNNRVLAQALSNLGIVYHALANYPQAINFQQQYLDLLRRDQQSNQGSATARQSLRLNEVQALGNLGGAYYLQGDVDRAISFYEEGLRIAFEIAEARMAAIIRNNLALAYAQKYNNNPAPQNQQQLLDFYQRFINNIPPQAGSLEGLARNNYAVAYHRANNPASAESQFIRGMESWEKVRQNLGSNDGYKVSFLETQGAIYNNFQKFLTEQNKAEQALEISERGRARTFVDLISRRLTPRTTQAPKVEPIAGLQIQKLAQEQNATLIEYSIIYEDFVVNNQLRPQESELFIWVVQPTGKITQRRVDLKLLAQGKQTSLAGLVNRTRDVLGVGRGGGRNTYPQLLQELYQILIDPIADLLPPPVAAESSNPAQNPERLIIIPHRSLFLLPFPALQDAQGKYLIDKYALQTAPSIQVLQLTQRQRQENSGQEVLIVGNPTMPLITIPGIPPQKLEALPGAEQEALAIAQIFKVSAMTGDQATKAAIVRQMPRSKIIHLATHGLLNDFSGGGVPGAIVLANSAANSPNAQAAPNVSQLNQGLLTAAEILNLRLTSKLVVLSACDTGRGKITGDGVIGLSRSFLAAGAASVLVSLWAIPDAPTAELMETFYQQLRSNPDEAFALQRAMIATKAKHPHPQNWAAFTLIGENK
ncbi:MAG: CHAT domain-containing protein [Coleofasciculaceae cyanobacterium SM2_1_6]|nr:CHAT domain-containing protein [Coleofasciculaceae cyanobacterium SM2_1_6]